MAGTPSSLRETKMISPTSLQATAAGQEGSLKWCKKLKTKPLQMPISCIWTRSTTLPTVCRKWMRPRFHSPHRVSRREYSSRRTRSKSSSRSGCWSRRTSSWYWRIWSIGCVLYTRMVIWQSMCSRVCAAGRATMRRKKSYTTRNSTCLIRVSRRCTMSSILSRCWGRWGRRGCSLKASWTKDSVRCWSSNEKI